MATAASAPAASSDSWCAPRSASSTISLSRWRKARRTSPPRSLLHRKGLLRAGPRAGGLPRAAILKALATDKGDLSRYLAVARAAPQPLVWAIGPAPKAGRARWLALTEALARAGWSEGQALPRPLQALLEKQSFAAADSDGRFALALAALARKAEPVAGPTEIRSAEGAVIGRLSDDGNRASLSFAGDAKGFAAFLAAEAPALWRRWRAERGD